jgi:ADP-heptose:LPS heptosyltransferase
MNRSFFIQGLFSILATIVGRRQSDVSNLLERAKSIILFKPDGIGDYILWSRFFQECSQRCPNSKITVVCCAPTGELVRCMFPRFRVVQIPQRPKDIFGFIWMLCRNPKLILVGQHDVLVDLRPHRVSWELLYVILLRANGKIGLQRSVATLRGAILPEDRFYNLLVAPLTSAQAQDEGFECAELDFVRQFSSFFWGSAITSALPDLRMFSWPQPKLPTGKRHWVIGPFSGNAIRDYPTIRWREVFQQLVSTSRPDSLLICGAASQREKAEQFGKMMQGILPVTNLCGSLTLVETAGLLLESELVFATESALAHLSVALRRPTIVILGGGHFGLFAPWGTKIAPVRWMTNQVDCYGCNWACIHSSAICIQNIPTSKIVEASMDLIVKVRS